MKNRFSEAQITGFLREAEGGMPSDLRRQHGFSEASYYRWRRKFGGMNVPDGKQLKDLEAEKTRLSKPLAEQVFENGVTKDALRKSGDLASAQAVDTEHGAEGVEQATSACGRTDEYEVAGLCASPVAQR